MSLVNKHKQWVLDTVDRLRQRKARPDLERISRMVERFHGLTHAETKESLDKLCDEGVVIKVHFKGNVSYRHIRNDKGPSCQNSLIYNTSSRIITAIKAIMKQTGDGVSFENMENWLKSKNPDTRLVKHRLNTALEKEITRGNVTKLPDNCYVLTESLPKEKKTPEHPRCEVKSKVKVDKTQTATDEKSNTHSTASLRCDAKQKEKVSKTPVTDRSRTTENKVSDAKPKQKNPKPSTSTPEENGIPSTERQENSPTKEQPRRGRPLSKRKRFKKTHGPDFENPLELKKGLDKEEEEEEEEEEEKEETLDTCDFCTLSSLANPEGKEEPLLICKECNAKAHPSCMDYSPELAQRALNSPWQCMECKMCAICGQDGIENSEVMLFCDSCDKGYHMTCNKPPLTSKPKGKWVCTQCKTETIKEAASEQKVDMVVKEEEHPVPKKRGRKRKISSPTTQLSLKCPKPDSQHINGTSSEAALAAECTGVSNDTACLPTPSASPRPSDTFDFNNIPSGWKTFITKHVPLYEMKMSLAGLTFPIMDDSTIYSDATDWNIKDVVNFFEECGFKNEAQAFYEQEIDGKSLLLLRREDVLTGLGLKLGPAVKIYKKVARLQQCSQSSLVS